MKIVKTAWISLLLSVALAAAAFANAGHQLLLSQTKAERATTLAGILQTSGKTCAEVSRSFLQGTDENQAAYWNAECSGGETYVIQVPASSQTRVLECKVMAMVGVECFTRFER